jgi:excinuclease ABC subunit C
MAEVDLEARLATISTGPGVYLLKDAHGKVIYVGKAVSLRARVRSYVRGGDERSQVRFLVGRLADVDTLVTANEKEALILENTLIKQYRPRYNIRLKDDKSYVSVKVTMTDAWPRVLVTRRIVKDGSRYFGPFHSASAVRDTLDTIRKVFPLRTCSDPVFRNRSRPCIEYDIKRCLAPCVLPVDRAAYDEHLRQAMLLLEGRNREVAGSLRERMSVAADAERLEDAARLRDQIRALERNGYGSNGEYVCIDVHPFRTTKPEHWMDHLLNSRRTFMRLLEKVRSFAERAAQRLIADRNYQALDQMVIEHLLGR